MKWIKKRPECNTIEDVVLANTGKTKEEFFDEAKIYSIAHLDEAVNVIKSFINNGGKITIIGDYDCDGVCSSAIMNTALKTAGAADVTVRLPKRFSEGYGLSEKIIDEIDSGLVITVDNGITAVDEIKKAKDKGLTVIVIDHHLRREDGLIPEADIVIDPNAIENTATFNGYCGAGLAYKLSVELLGKEHWIIKKLLSMAAIATIADVMQLTDENRIIVREGMKTMITRQGRTTGLSALLEVCEASDYITEKNISFKVAPVINAAGRMFDDGAMIPFRLLSFNGSLDKAREMAEKMNSINEDRKAEKTKGLEALEVNIIDNCLYGECPLIIYEPGLHEGLIGIYAGSLAEKYRVPCFVFTNSEDSNIYKGSARTYGGVHLKNLLDKHADILYKYGGHAEAAGVSVEAKNFNQMVDDFIGDNIEVDSGDADTVYYDIEIKGKDIPTVIEELKRFTPFGNGNPEIVFYVNDYELSPSYGQCYKFIGSEKQHLRLNGVKSEAIGFDMAHAYEAMDTPKDVDVVGTLSTNCFNRRITNQVELIDIHPVVVPEKTTAFAKVLQEKAIERFA